jgi:hypothetical protein
LKNNKSKATNRTIILLYYFSVLNHTFHRNNKIFSSSGGDIFVATGFNPWLMKSISYSFGGIFAFFSKNCDKTGAGKETVISSFAGMTALKEKE